MVEGVPILKPDALRKAKTPQSFGLSECIRFKYFTECNRVKHFRDVL